MSLFDELRELGVDVDGGLRRINNNEKLYTRLLGSFVKSIDSQYVGADFDASDVTAQIERAFPVEFRVPYIIQGRISVIDRLENSCILGIREFL